MLELFVSSSLYSSLLCITVLRSGTNWIEVIFFSFSFKFVFLVQECGFNRMHQSEAAASPVGHRLPGYMEYQGMGFRPQFPVERKWALGLQVKFL